MGRSEQWGSGAEVWGPLLSGISSLGKLLNPHPQHNSPKHQRFTQCFLSWWVFRLLPPTPGTPRRGLGASAPHPHAVHH